MFAVDYVKNRYLSFYWISVSCSEWKWSVHLFLRLNIHFGLIQIILCLSSLSRLLSWKSQSVNFWSTHFVKHTRNLLFSQPLMFAGSVFMAALEINILPVPVIVSGSLHFVTVTRNSWRSSLHDILLKFENLSVIVTSRKRILSVTYGIVPDSDWWPAVISCTVMVILGYTIYTRPLLKMREMSICG